MSEELLESDLRKSGPTRSSARDLPASGGGGQAARGGGEIPCKLRDVQESGQSWLRICLADSAAARDDSSCSNVRWPIFRPTLGSDLP